MIMASHFCLIRWLLKVPRITIGLMNKADCINTQSRLTSPPFMSLLHPCPQDLHSHIRSRLSLPTSSLAIITCARPSLLCLFNKPQIQSYLTWIPTSSIAGAIPWSSHHLPLKRLVSRNRSLDIRRRKDRHPCCCTTLPHSCIMLPITRYVPRKLRDRIILW